MYGWTALPLVLFEIALAIGVSALAFGVLFPLPGSKRYIARQEAKREIAKLEAKVEVAAEKVQAQSGPSLTYRTAGIWGQGAGTALRSSDFLTDVTDSVVFSDAPGGRNDNVGDPFVIGKGTVTLQRGDGMPTDSAIAVMPVEKPRRVPDGTRDLDIDL